MAKRPAVSFPELEGRGRRAILRTPEEVQAEKELLERQDAGIPDVRETSSPDTQHAGMPEIQHASTPEGQSARPPESWHDCGRASYPKATYRLSPDALDAIEDAKRMLRRRYHLRVSLEDIAEEAILEAYRDLLKHQESSTLVSRLSRKPVNRNASKPER